MPVYHDISDIHLIRRLTVQIFIGTVLDIDFEMIDPHHSILYVETKGWRRLFEFTIQKSREPVKIVNNNFVKSTRKRDVWYGGLNTKNVNPTDWCMRVVSLLQFKVKSSMLWVDWGKCMWEMYREYFAGDLVNQYREKHWLSSTKEILRNEFNRLGMKKVALG